MSSVEFVTKWFTLQGLGCFRRPGEASKVREVAVVTHNLFLQGLFGERKLHPNIQFVVLKIDFRV
jgi:hypothetical protein